MTKADVINLIETKVREAGPLAGAIIGPESRLVGKGADIGSMGLVNLIVDLEGDLLEEGFEVELASQEAMSSSRSPFRTIDSLADHIIALMGE